MYRDVRNDDIHVFTSGGASAGSGASASAGGVGGAGSGAGSGACSSAGGIRQRRYDRTVGGGFVTICIAAVVVGDGGSCAVAVASY